MTCRREHGFTYIMLLIAVAIMGIVLAGAATAWSTQRQREAEEELKFVGEEFRRAIALYYYRSPGINPQYPRSLQDLVDDPRYPGVQRYLRKIYRDPLTGQKEWGLVRASDGGIAGVHSQSKLRPFNSRLAASKDGESYASYQEMKFVFQPVGVADAGARRPTTSGMR